MAAEKRTFLDKFTEFSVRLGNQVHLKSLRDAFCDLNACLYYRRDRCVV